MGIISCGLMMSGLDWTNWLRLALWLAIGMAIYYLYGRKNSKIGKEE
jgi:APA family basic amino acid/polyamine antiporter